jgi:hypothetical protein
VETIKRSPARLPNCEILEVCPTGKMPHQTVTYALQSCRFNNLLKLAIKCTCHLRNDEVRLIHVAAFDFMVRNTSLRVLVINTVVSKQDQIPALKISLLRPEREIKDVATKVQLKQLCLTEEIVNFHLWWSFLLEQKRLEIIQVTHLMMFPVMYHVILNNYKTLRKIAFHCSLQYEGGLRDGKRDMVLDLGIFGQCERLTELCVFVAGPHHPRMILLKVRYMLLQM